MEYPPHAGHHRSQVPLPSVPSSLPPSLPTKEGTVRRKQSGSDSQRRRHNAGPQQSSRSGGHRRGSGASSQDCPSGVQTRATGWAEGPVSAAAAAAYQPQQQRQQRQGTGAEEGADRNLRDTTVKGEASVDSSCGCECNE
eukprot:GHVU01012869.1.p2 GENE.GHVU01012869.1~~GHVU01012869.1.p2  ORF type:complete len:140 (+),score=19.24 GHVU01012869.1:167-586(+)